MKIKIRERDKLKDTGVDGRITLETDLRKIGWDETWTTFIWLRIGTSGGLFRMW